jgi:uncharacterized protein Smg (DUF494 family)
MTARVLAALRVNRLSVNALVRFIGLGHQDIYVELVRLEALGMVRVDQQRGTAGEAMWTALDEPLRVWQREHGQRQQRACRREAARVIA